LKFQIYYPKVIVMKSQLNLNKEKISYSMEGQEIIQEL